MMKHIVLGFLFSGLIIAQDQFKISGFGTMGWVQVDSESYGFRNDISIDEGVFKGENGFKALSNLGVQFNLLLNQKMELVTQWVYSQQPEYDLEHLTRMAFLKIEPNPLWQIRLGRTPLDIFNLSEYRDIGIAYPWAKVPVEVYGSIPHRTLDGMDVTHHMRLGEIEFQAKIFAGMSSSEISSIHLVEPVDFKQVFGVSLAFEKFFWQLKLNYSRATIKDDTPTMKLLAQSALQFEPLWPFVRTFLDSMSIRNELATYFSINGNLDLAPFSLATELAHISTSSQQIRPTDIGYLSLSYQKKRVTGYTVFSFSESPTYHFDEFVFYPQLLTELTQYVEMSMNAFSPDQKTVSLGFRWDILNNLAFKAQWDQTKVATWGGALYLAVDGSNLKEGETINQFTYNLSFSF